MEQLISVIVPIYNAEKYLGYCLNSIVSQTYPHWEAILVNDGSKDSSLDICQNYAQADERFQVISIPNGGVSNARNTGVAAAKGDYFFFLDSDDVITEDALECLLKLEQEYHTGLAVGDVQLADFDRKCRLEARLCADWTGDKRCWSRQEFAQNKMRLIWHTSMLEGPYCKLYSARIWREAGVFFPTELSLGEDLMANLAFFDHCSGIAFAKKTLHYYNNPQQSNSLSHKYRADLFGNKMLLCQALRTHLGDWSRLDPQEQDCFYKYVVHSGCCAVQELLKDTDHLTDEAKKAELSQIAQHALLRESLENVSKVEPTFLSWKPLILENRVDELMKHASRQQKSRLRPCVSGVKQTACAVLRKTARLVPPLSGKINRLEETIRVRGVKAAYAEYWPFGRTGRKLNQLLEEVQRASANLQRQMTLNEINELRQKKKAVLIATSEHANIGDAAISLAAQYLIGELYPEYHQVEFSTYEDEQRYEYLQAIIHPQDILFLNGGGNMGSLYPEEEALHRRIVQDFPNHKIVVLPQTIDFEPNENGRRELALSRQVYNSHPDLTFFLRGQKSTDFTREYFPHVHAVLMPDLVFHLRRNYHFERTGILLCLRDDKEGVLSGEDSQTLLQTAQRFAPQIDRCSNMADCMVTRDKRAAVVNEELKRHARHRAVITDRLHGMIFAVVTGTPVVVFKSSNQKIEEFYHAFLHDSNAVFYIGSDMDKLPEALEQALAVTQPVYPLLDKAPLKQLRNLIERN